MISSLDHLTVVVRDLDAAARDYATLFGRTPNWSGSDAGAEHVWFQLSNMALDLIAPTGPGYIGDFLRTRLNDVGEGLWALAFATPDVQNMHRILRRRDVKAAAPQPIRARNAQSGVEREWLTTILDTGATHGVTIAIVEQQSGSVAWSPAAFSAAQDAAVSGLDHVVVTTPQPERALAFYGARLDLEMALDSTNPDWGARLMFFRCGELTSRSRTISRRAWWKAPISYGAFPGEPETSKPRVRVWRAPEWMFRKCGPDASRYPCVHSSRSQCECADDCDRRVGTLDPHPIDPHPLALRARW